MARIELGRQGILIDFTLRNVRAKTRFSSLEERITWDSIKGAIQKRPGRERQQEKWVKDAPIIEVIEPEYQARLEDVTKIVTRGWMLVEEEPVECWMGDLLLDLDASVLNMSAKVESNNVSTDCGFIIATNQQFTDAVVHAAIETPVQSVVPEKITYSLPLAGLEGVNLYILPYGDDGNKIAYGIVKHIELPSSF